MTKKKNKKPKNEEVEQPPPHKIYPCYVRIRDSKGDSESVELPTQEDGTLLLSTVTAQFPDAIGLRFKGESGTWRGVRVNENIINPPLESWGSGEYYIVRAKTYGKRKSNDDDDDDDTGSKKVKTEKEMLADLIVLGIPYATTEDELKSYFETFGELDHHEIKFDPQTKKSRGFGFIRYKTVESVESVLAESHSIGGRSCEVSFPKKRTPDDTPTKLFVGRLTQGTTVEDLREYFSEYGPLKDVYIPKTFRGFGFVTFASEAAAKEVLQTTHVLKGNYVNVTYPAPKPGQQNSQNMLQQQQQQQYGYGNMQGNMQQMQQMHPQGSGYGNQYGSNMNGGYTWAPGYFQNSGNIR